MLFRPHGELIAWGSAANRYHVTNGLYHHCWVFDLQIVAGLHKLVFPVARQRRHIDLVFFSLYFELSCGYVQVVAVTSVRAREHDQRNVSEPAFL